MHCDLSKLGHRLTPAITLAAAGAKVLIIDVKEDALNAAVEKIKGEVSDAVVFSVVAAPTKLDYVNELVKAANEQGGGGASALKEAVCG